MDDKYTLSFEKLVELLYARIFYLGYGKGLTVLRELIPEGEYSFNKTSDYIAILPGTDKLVKYIRILCCKIPLNDGKFFIVEYKYAEVVNINGGVWNIYIK